MSLSDATSRIPAAVEGRIAERIDAWWVDLPPVADRHAAIELVRSFERATNAPGLAQIGLLPFLQPFAAGAARLGRARSAGLVRFVRGVGSAAIVLGAGSRLLGSWRRISAELRVLGAIAGAASAQTAPELSSTALQLFLDPSSPPDRSAATARFLPSLIRHIARGAVRRRPDEAATLRRIDAAFGSAAPMLAPATPLYA